MRREKTIIRWLFILATVASLSVPGGALGAEKKSQLQLDLPQPDVPDPQFFCGYCHILTYPSIVQKGYDLWKKGKHKDVGCVECHYPPQEIESPKPQPGKTGKAETKHIPAKPPERFAYIPLGGHSVQTRPRVVDASCMTANCHGKPDDKFKTKKIKFTEKVYFTHEPHFDKKNQIEGMKLNCTSCHQHETDKKKFEVSRESCHLCHFTKVKFNQGRGRCELCHELPKKPIQTSGENPITHQILKDAKVGCSSCHIELIQASGGATYQAYFEKGKLKTALVLGAGRTKKENCLACHDQAKQLKEAGNQKLMHQKHVTVKNARCLECHEVIKHSLDGLKQSKAKDTMDKKLASAKEYVRDSCLACHPEPHDKQLFLTAGQKLEGVLAAPSPHETARASCLACHREQGITKKGQRVLKASDKICISCHKGRKTLLKDWKDELEKEVKYTREVEQEAVQALKKAKPKLTKEKLAEAKKMLAEGRDHLNMVRLGNGVHNKKYAIMLLDAALTSFEDLMDSLEESQQ
jgi:hypothetical protein